MACQSTSGSEYVWLNRVGTFEVSSASYWWGHKASLLGRLTLLLSPGSWLFQLLFADDLRWSACGPDKFPCLAKCLFLWVRIGVPFSWGKCRGGIEVDWVGYYLDYGRFAIGISESRTLWLISWAERILRDGFVLLRNLAEGVGRLSFTMGVLEWGKPFLAPLYSLVAVMPGGATISLPPLVRLTLAWIVMEMKGGRRTTPCSKPEEELGELFRTDASATETKVVIGGWETVGPQPDAKTARWFSLEISAEEAPWLFVKGHGSYTIGASEMLASLVALEVFAGSRGAARGTASCSGATDNLSNAFIVNKMLTTRMPGAAVLMQLASTMSKKGLWLSLAWRRRDTNVEADDLTNSLFDRFDLKLRIPINLKELDFKVLDGLLELLPHFEKARESLKKRKEAEAPPAGRKKRRGKRPVKLPWA